MRVISLSDSWHTAQRLYCTSENFGQISEYVRQRFFEAQQWRIAHPTPARKINYRWYIFWTIVTIVAGFAATAWETEEILGVVFFGSLMVLLAGFVEGFLRRALAFLGLVATLVYGYMIGTLAFEFNSYAQGYISWYGYEYDTGFLLISLFGGLALLVLSLWRLVGSTRRA
jgi:hypothetical protein